MPSVAQCKVFAEQCREGARAAGITSQRAHMLNNLARSWAAVVHQLETRGDTPQAGVS